MTFLLTHLDQCMMAPASCYRAAANWAPTAQELVLLQSLSSAGNVGGSIRKEEVLQNALKITSWLIQQECCFHCVETWPVYPRKK